MKTMKEELANLEAVKRELDDQKSAKVEANQDVSDDDDDLDSYSDSVEKWELEDGESTGTVPTGDLEWVCCLARGTGSRPSA